MPEFMYRAKKGPTEIVNGSVEAASLDEAVEKLDHMGLFPIHLDEMKPGDKKTGPFLKENNPEVTEKNLIDAFFKETPFGFHGPMKTDMESVGIDYTKYGHPK